MREVYYPDLLLNTVRGELLLEVPKNIDIMISLKWLFLIRGKY